MTYEWSDTREHAVAAFHQYPPGPLEARIVEAFERDPVAVQAAVDRTAERHAQGRVNAPWHYLAKQAEQILEQAPDVVAADTNAREKRVRAAESWVHTAGVYFDREDELVDELFKPPGLLRDYADDEVLQARMVKLWREQRPRGEKAEAQ